MKNLIDYVSQPVVEYIKDKDVRREIRKIFSFTGRGGSSTPTGTSTSLNKYSTTQMNALTGMDSGDLIYNTTANRPYFYNGTEWLQL